MADILHDLPIQGEGEDRDFDTDMIHRGEISSAWTAGLVDDPGLSLVVDGRAGEGEDCKGHRSWGDGSSGDPFLDPG